MRERVLVTKLRLKPPSDDERSVRESSLPGGRCAAAKTASKASFGKTCFISPEHSFRRCLGVFEKCDHAPSSLVTCAATAQGAPTRSGRGTRSASNAWPLE